MYCTVVYHKVNFGWIFMLWVGFIVFDILYAIQLPGLETRLIVSLRMAIVVETSLN